MAAVLSCRSPRRAEDGATGPGEPQALLSHSSAAALWGIAPDRGGVIHVTVRRLSPKRVPGIRAHRRTVLASEDLAVYKLIPTTGVVQTLVDLAGAVRGKALERAVNEADRLDLIDPESLRAALRRHRGRPGVAPLRRLLTDHEFRLTDSELERRFLLLVRRSGLPTPIAGQQLNGFRVDFFWPAIGLVVETDGLRYHRTPAQQARDRLRDQAHVAAGLSTLRFTHRQVRFEGDHVIATLRSALGAR